MSAPDPLSVSLASLKALYLVINFTIDVNHCPNEVRRCLELVRTLYGDLQHLINLRNECLPVLSARPAILARTDLVITNAHDGLAEVCAIVEKLRPDRGKTSMQKRFAWIFLDSKEFKSQEPLVSRQHASVLTEVNFLRMMVLSIGHPAWAVEDSGGKPNAPVPRVTAFNNISLLDDMMAGGRRESSISNAEKVSSPTQTQAPASVVPVVQKMSPKPSLFPGPWVGPPSSPLGEDSDMSSLQSRRSTVFSTSGMSLLFGEASRRTSEEQNPPDHGHPDHPSPVPRSAQMPESPSYFHGAPRGPEPSPTTRPAPVPEKSSYHQGMPCCASSPTYESPFPHRRPQMSLPPRPIPVPDHSVAIPDPRNRVVCEAGYAAHYGLRHPPPPLSLRHRTAHRANSTLPWVPSIIEQLSATQNPNPAPNFTLSPSYSEDIPAPTLPSRYPGHLPAYGESLRWNSGATGVPAAFDSTGHVWIQEDSSRLSTIPPELIYSPPQIPLPRPSMPVAHCPYPTTPPR